LTNTYKISRLIFSTESKLHIKIERRTVLICTFGTLQYCTLEYYIYGAVHIRYIGYRYCSIADANTSAIAAATIAFVVVVVAYDAVAAAIVVVVATSDATGGRVCVYVCVCVCVCVHVCVGVRVYIYKDR